MRFENNEFSVELFENSFTIQHKTNPVISNTRTVEYRTVDKLAYHPGTIPAFTITLHNTVVSLRRGFSKKLEDSSNRVTCRPKEEPALQQLYRQLQANVERYRVHPPSPDTQMFARNSKGLRQDVSDAAKGKSLTGRKKGLYVIEERLLGSERVQSLMGAQVESTLGLLVLTTQRIFFVEVNNPRNPMLIGAQLNTLQKLVLVKQSFLNSKIEVQDATGISYLFTGIEGTATKSFMTHYKMRGSSDPTVTPSTSPNPQAVGSFTQPTSFTIPPTDSRIVEPDFAEKLEKMEENSSFRELAKHLLTYKPVPRSFTHFDGKTRKYEKYEKADLAENLAKWKTNPL